MKKHVFVIWRLDGDFMFTEIPTHARPARDASTDEWVTAAIREEHESHAYDESEIADLIGQAVDPDHPHFAGYEIIAIFDTDEMLGFIY